MKLPPYDNFPSITGDKISLRQIRISDNNDLIEISFYDGVQAKSSEEAKDMQLKIDRDYAAGNTIHWGIADNTTNKLVGTCGYYRGLDKGEGELGCILLPQYQGLGYMTAAMQLAIDFGINNIGLKRIWAVTSQQNKNAMRLLERLNFHKSAHNKEGQIEYDFPIKKN